MKRTVNLKLKLAANLTGFKGLGEVEDLPDLISTAVENVLTENLEAAIGDELGEFDEDGDGNVEVEVTVSFS